MLYEPFRKKVIRERGLIIGAIVVLCSLGLYLNMEGGHYRERNQQIIIQLTAIETDIATLRERYVQIQKNPARYQDIVKKDSEGGFAISRDTARDTFDRLRTSYYLDNLHLSMSPLHDLAESKYRRATRVVSASDIALSFNTLSDEHVFGLLASITGQLPGASRITRLTLSREDGSITDDILRDISQSGEYPLVKGQIKFTWLGIKPLETGTDDAIIR